MLLFNKNRSEQSGCTVKKPIFYSLFGTKKTKGISMDTCSYSPKIPFNNTTVRYENFAKDGFYKNVILYRTISLIARSVASIKWNVYEDDVLLENSEIKNFICMPNGKRDRYNLVESAISYLLLCGNIYLYMSKNPLEMQILRPDRVEIVPTRDNTEISHYEYCVNNSKFKIADTGRVIHIKFFNPIDDWYGFSPVHACAYSVDQHNAVSKHNISVLNKGGRPSGCLIHSNENGPLTESQVNRLRDDVDTVYSGTDNAGKILLLDGEFKWQDFGDYSKDFDFNKGKEISAREIAQAFGVPPMLVGVTGDSTFANYKEARFHFWEDTVIPLAEYFVAELTVWLNKNIQSNITIKLNLDDISALVVKRDKVWNRISNCNFLTINEKRKILGYPELNSEELSEFSR